VQGQAGYLPLLQYILDLLWKTEIQTGGIQRRTLELSTYRQSGESGMHSSNEWIQFMRHCWNRNNSLPSASFSNWWKLAVTLKVVLPENPCDDEHCDRNLWMPQSKQF
jgi:hypothetical protein